MTREGLIAQEREAARTYRREAMKRAKNPTLAARLREWATASDRRADEMRSGPLFGASE